MKSQDQLVTIGLAAKEAGVGPIEYPVFHAFTYYLKQKEKVGFDAYLFNACAFPPSPDLSEPMDFPCSVELVEDMNSLVSRGLYKEVVGSTAYAVTSRAERLQERYVREWEETRGALDFASLRKKAGELLSNPEALVRASYRLYIRHFA